MCFCPVIYKYGSPSTGFWGEFTLNNDGTLYGYSHPNEKFWMVEHEKFYFLSENRDVTSTFNISNFTSAMLGRANDSLCPLCLIPILDMTDLLNNSKRNYKIFINSVPKSGTYFFEKALGDIDFNRSRLHLSSFFVDDYRKVFEQDIHKSPEKVRIHGVSADILMKALPSGNIAVGHIDDADIIKKIRDQKDVILISVIRDLRDILVSMYHFKINKVNDRSIGDTIWKKIKNDKDRFYAFLSFYAETDLMHIKKYVVNND
ncbi:sulfotransferase domain-containing protein [Dickeya oryzae]